MYTWYVYVIMYTWCVYLRYVYLICIREYVYLVCILEICILEVCILDMYTWICILGVYIWDMCTWYLYVNMYTWYVYLRNVHLMWIREVCIHGTSTWSMYACHEYVKYVLWYELPGICTVEMDNCRLWYLLINMWIPCMSKDDETRNWCPWDMRTDIGITWGSCRIWQTQKVRARNVWLCIRICIRHNGAVNYLFYPLRSWRR